MSKTSAPKETRFQTLLFEALHLRSWLKSRQEGNAHWYPTIKDEDLKRLLDRTEEQIDTLKRRRTYEESDLEKLFGVYFASLDAALQAINDWQRSWSDAVDRENCSSECAEFTNQELAIYKKRFGEIPKEEIDKELFGVDDEAKEDDLPF